MKKYYFSYISNRYTLKNKLHKAVYELLVSQERVIIEADKFKEFKKYIISSIERCNAAYPRCTPLKPEWSDEAHVNVTYNSAERPYEDCALYLGYGVCNFYLYQSK
jgi:hypothetical protein